MPVVSSSMMPLGAEAPNFALPDVRSGRQLSLEDCMGPKGAVVMFICNHCPYVVHIRDALLSFAADYADSGVGLVAISVNDASRYPDDSPEKMAELAQQMAFPFPYLYDEARTARAATMPCARRTSFCSMASAAASTEDNSTTRARATTFRSLARRCAMPWTA